MSTEERFYSLTLDGIDAGVWQVRNIADAAAVALANRHYSRERRGSRQVGGPRPRLILVTPCERAVWITERNIDNPPVGRGTSDGLNAWRCTMFRNEGAGLSSDLIRAAMDLTVQRWGQLPSDGWITWVDRTKLPGVNPGYCFERAGWYRDHEWEHPRLIRWRADW